MLQLAALELILLILYTVGWFNLLYSNGLYFIYFI